MDNAKCQSLSNSDESDGDSFPLSDTVSWDIAQTFPGRHRLTPSTALYDATARAGVNIHQFYRLDMPQAKSAALADIYAFEGTRGIGEPTKYTIQFTHPRHDLSRTEYLNRPCTFLIQPPPRDRWSQPESARQVYGMVTNFAQLSSNRDQSTYEVVLESRLALLRGTRRCRFFLDMSEPEIIRQILKEHDFNQIFASFEFNLYREYRKRSFVMQWGEDDLTFITRLCQRTGIWFVCEAGEKCENVRFGDDLTHYRHDSSLKVPYREQSGLVTDSQESVQSLETRATTVPKRHTVRSYHTEHRPAEPVEASNDIQEDRTVYGEDYVWGAPYLTEDEAKREALLRHEAALAAQIEYHGTCDLLDLTPGSVLKLTNRDLPDAKYGLLAVRVTCRASRKKAYHVEFDAIPSDRLFRLPLKEETWPRIEGVITGTVASTEGWRDPYLDSQGRYIVHIHADKDKRTPGLESCPMRLAKPFAGAGQAGFHFGLVEGTVVTVGFLWGNPELPYISQVLHTAEDTDPIVAGAPWGTRNTIRTRSNNTLEMDDREGKEHIKVATECGKTQLNLGHTVDRDNKDRGEGFELRTDMRGHVRAGGGVLVSADKQEQAHGEQTDMRPATNQLQLTQAQAQGLVDAAAVAKAEIADLRAENAWLKDELAGLKQAVIALSAPHGIGIATPDRVMMSAGKDVSVATSSRFNVNALRNVAIAAGETLSLFAHKLGMKLFAARGKVQIQAQSDAMELVSQKNMQITSADGTATVNAANGVILSGGGSAYIKVHGDNVEIGGAGNLVIKMAKLQKTGPGALSLPLPKFSQVDIANDERFILSDGITGRPVANRPYKIQLASGQIVEGVTNDQGETSLSRQDVAQGLKLLIQNHKEA
ncbi:type VI secretion system Vgr family protein [Paraburkholderia phenoliruptrix]|uniref:type VI secretion system Vgr family protein n=1 Tax=Paraburkholderia phenoliruptrix TaxID=252970 RepID=UPI001FC89186|nr:type VI secretion system Vgr family protein [Paraburkholderia phenoliruptrix]